MADRRRDRLNDPREAVTGWAARALGGGDAAADARSLRRLERIAATGGGAARDAVGGVGSVETVVAATGSNVTNTSTSTWVNHLTTSKVLAAGTWKVTLLYIGTYSGDVYTTFYFEFQIVAPVVGAITSGAAVGAGRVTISAAVAGNVASDGVTATSFTAQFRKTSTADAPRAETGSILAICQRVS